jgi:hypothetical protein
MIVAMVVRYGPSTAPLRSRLRLKSTQCGGFSAMERWVGEGSVEIRYSK